MNYGDAHHNRPHHEASDAGLTSFTMNTFQWLLVLGFPVNVAAAQTMPELFTSDEALSAEKDEWAREGRLQTDRAGVNSSRWA